MVKCGQGFDHIVIYLILCIDCTTALRVTPQVNLVKYNQLDVSKLAWLHVPKAGSSFGNTLFTWACPQLPDDAQLPVVESGGIIEGFYKKHQAECDPGFKICGGHNPLGKGCNKMQKHSGNFVALFRQPEQRIMSGFYHDRHDYANKGAPIEEYASGVAGCAVGMMLGRSCGSNKGQVNADDAEQAIKILEDEFAFVGLTDEWDLSVCLFHKMHGGKCHSREFVNTRPGISSSKQYDTQTLGGFTDEVDGKLYARAKQLFWSNVDKFGVTGQSCKETCESISGGRFAFNED